MTEEKITQTPSTLKHLPYFTHHDSQDNNPLFPLAPIGRVGIPITAFDLILRHVISFSFLTADFVAQSDFTLVSRWDEGCHPSSLAAWDATASVFPTENMVEWAVTGDSHQGAAEADNFKGLFRLAVFTLARISGYFGVRASSICPIGGLGGARWRRLGMLWGESSRRRSLLALNWY